MGFKRAEWHSGLTYRQTCDQCHTVLTYKDDVLDFRPWYADGFVVCPKCKKPLRHKEAYDISRDNGIMTSPATLSQEVPIAPAANIGESQKRHAFCTNCGKAFEPNDNFCSNCGNKRS